MVRRRATRRRLDRHRRADGHRRRRRAGPDRARRHRRHADAHRTRPRLPAAADPRHRHDRAARARAVASVGRLARRSDRTPARRRVRRLRDRRSARRRPDTVDRRAAAVHGRAVRGAAGHRYDDPRGALDAARDVLHPRLRRLRRRRIRRRRVRRIRRRRVLRRRHRRDGPSRRLLRRLLRHPAAGRGSVGGQAVARRRRRRTAGVALQRRHADGELPARGQHADRPGTQAAQEEAVQAAAEPVDRPRGGGPVRAAVAGPADPRRPAEAAQREQRPHDRGDHLGAATVQGRRRGHRLHPRPDSDPLRGRARPGCQGRENHRAATQYRLRGGHRERAPAGADPR